MMKQKIFWFSLFTLCLLSISGGLSKAQANPLSGNYYERLGLADGASLDEIKKAYRQLAKTYHPDNQTTGNEETFKKINEAYENLKQGRAGSVREQRPQRPPEGNSCNKSNAPEAVDAFVRKFFRHLYNNYGPDDHMDEILWGQILRTMLESSAETAFEFKHISPKQYMKSHIHSSMKVFMGKEERSILSDDDLDCWYEDKIDRAADYLLNKASAHAKNGFRFEQWQSLSEKWLSLSPKQQQSVYSSTLKTLAAGAAAYSGYLALTDTTTQMAARRALAITGPVGALVAMTSEANADETLDGQLRFENINHILSDYEAARTLLGSTVYASQVIAFMQMLTN